MPFLPPVDHVLTVMTYPAAIVSIDQLSYVLPFFPPVDHVLTVMTCLAAVVSITRSFIPDEHLIWCPEKLLVTVLSHIHYMPDGWKVGHLYHIHTLYMPGR